MKKGVKSTQLEEQQLWKYCSRMKTVERPWKSWEKRGDEDLDPREVPEDNARNRGEWKDLFAPLTSQWEKLTKMFRMTDDWIT